MINNIFSKLEYLKYLISKKKPKIFKTIYINLRSLPFSVAIKFPIFVYGKCEFVTLKGSIEINGEIKMGMIHIGVPDIRSVDSVSVIANRGTIRFNGNIIIRSGLRISVYNSGVLVFGKKCVLGDFTTIFCTKSITIGNGIRFANNVVVMDTDIHYLLNVETGDVQFNKKEIILGDYNWIGSFVSIKKGTYTPDYTIVVGPYSTACQDYRNTIAPYSMIAGNPAKLIRTGYLRVFNEKLEEKIDKHYSETNSVFKLDLNEIDKCLYSHCEKVYR